MASATCAGWCTNVGTGGAPDAGGTTGRSSLLIGSAEKVFRVLHAFDGPRRQLTLADIVRAAGPDRSSAQRAAHTLKVLGYAQRVPGSRTYRLTSKVLQFSYNYICANELGGQGRALPARPEPVAGRNLQPAGA